VADFVQVNTPFNSPITGVCAFTHKAGIHSKAILQVCCSKGFLGMYLPGVESKHIRDPQPRRLRFDTIHPFRVSIDGLERD
jgi:hypothetical protein